MGVSFFEKYSVFIDVKNHLLHPWTLHILMQTRKKSNNEYSNSFMELQTTQQIVIAPFQQVMVLVRREATYAPTNGAVEATPQLQRGDALLVSQALVTFTEGKTMLQITNPHGQT